MKPKPRLLGFTSAVFCFALSGLTQTISAATISGAVSNAATRASLEGAVVSLHGTSAQALTDRSGHFDLTGVAPASYTLEVTYTGLDSHTQPITVGADRVTVTPIGLRSDIYKLEAFTV